MSNGTKEPLPGLLDDPQFQIDLPWNAFPIAPLRNPAPQRNANAPAPLEPVTDNSISNTRSGGASSQDVPRRHPNIRPSDILQARESRKPHLAISELVDDNDEIGSTATHLPSFVSLSVVEKSPIPTPRALGRPSSSGAQKRPRAEQDGEYTTHDLGRQLPRPAKREHTIPRPAPLLPAMVTGLHEPPPSAALLPSMDPTRRPAAATRTASNSKIQVKDILTHTDSRTPSPVPVPSRQLPTPNVHGNTSRPLPHLEFGAHRPGTEPTMPTSAATHIPAVAPTTSRDGKTRRTRRKWSEDETHDLLVGVKKHGVGKWKQILTDSNFTFHERSAVDLKDRFRVCSKDGSHALMNSDTATKAASSTGTGTPSPNSPTTPSDHQPNSVSRPTSPSAAGSGLQKSRRKRRAWTSSEDNALLRGVAKYGFQWTAIHEDESLELSHRRATDLRDRIRNKFPDGYKMAESKPLRAEIKRAEKERDREREMDLMDTQDRSFRNKDAEDENTSLDPTLGLGGGGGGGGGRSDQSTKLAMVGGKTGLDHHHQHQPHQKGKPITTTTTTSISSNVALTCSSAAATQPAGLGVTLPSLTLDELDEMDIVDAGIRLPPLLPWDD